MEKSSPGGMVMIQGHAFMDATTIGLPLTLPLLIPPIRFPSIGEMGYEWKQESKYDVQEDWIDYQEALNLVSISTKLKCIR